MQKLGNVIKDKNMTVEELDSIFRRQSIMLGGLNEAEQLNDIILVNDDFTSRNEIDWDKLCDIPVVALAIKLEEELHHACRIPAEMPIIEFLSIYQEELLKVKKWLMENRL